MSPTGALMKINATDVSSATGNGVSGNVYAFAFDSSSNVYIGGNFHLAQFGNTGSVYNANYLAKINSSGVLQKINSSDTTSATGNGFNNLVSSLVTDSLGNVFVGGSFQNAMIGGSAVANNANYLAKLSPTGVLQSINALDSAGANTNGFAGSIQALAIDSNSNLYVGGAFGSCSEGGTVVTDNYFTKLSSSGGQIATVLSHPGWVLTPLPGPFGFWRMSAPIPGDGSVGDSGVA